MKKFYIGGVEFRLLTFPSLLLRCIISMLVSGFVAVFVYPRVDLMLLFFLGSFFVLIHGLTCHNYLVKDLQERKNIKDYYSEILGGRLFKRKDPIQRGTIFWPINKGNVVSNKVIAGKYHETKILGGLAGLGVLMLMIAMVQIIFRNGA